MQQSNPYPRATGAAKQSTSKNCRQERDRPLQTLRGRTGEGDILLVVDGQGRDSHGMQLRVEYLVSGRCAAIPLRGAIVALDGGAQSAAAVATLSPAGSAAVTSLLRNCAHRLKVTYITQVPRLRPRRQEGDLFLRVLQGERGCVSFKDKKEGFFFSLKLFENNEGISSVLQGE